MGGGSCVAALQRKGTQLEKTIDVTDGPQANFFPAAGEKVSLHATPCRSVGMAGNSASSAEKKKKNKKKNQAAFDRSLV